MALNKILLENFTVFEKMNIEFCNGINIFIGDNGTGKTHVMKLLYAACQSAQASKRTITFPQKIVQLFKPDASNISRLIKRGHGNGKVEVTSDKSTIKAHFTKHTKNWNADITGAKKWEEQLADLVSTFIPAKEILSNSKNLVNAVNAGNVEFDDTYTDIITAASVDIRKGPNTERCQKYLNKIQKITNGAVTLKDEKFYLRPGNRSMLEFSLVAEGIRKIALLWQLIKNGTLERGSVLFWDEPEANINPANIPMIVDLLLDLQRDGVQIFIATHDYFLAKYIDIKKKKSHNVQYHALYKSDDAVQHECETDFTSLENNSIIKQSIELYKEEVKKVMG